MLCQMFPATFKARKIRGFNQDKGLFPSAARQWHHILIISSWRMHHCYLPARISQNWLLFLFKLHFIRHFLDLGRINVFKTHEVSLTTSSLLLFWLRNCCWQKTIYYAFNPRFAFSQTSSQRLLSCHGTGSPVIMWTLVVQLLFLNWSLMFKPHDNNYTIFLCWLKQLTAQRSS